MKKTQWIDLFTTIRRNKVPYLAIVIFVTLGIALYGGMSWSCSYIDKALDKTCDTNRLAYMRVFYAYGISDNQMDELLQIDGVDDVEGYNYIYRFFEQDGERRQAAVYQLTEHIGAPSLISGTLPEAENEIAVLESWAEKNNVSIGDTLTFLDDYGSDYRQVQPVTSIAKWNPDGDTQPDIDTSDPGYLKTNTFTVTALVESPEYIMAMKAGYGTNSMNGVQVDAVMYVSKNAMNPELFNGYTSASIFSETLAEMEYGTDAYEEAYDALEESVTAVTKNWTDVPDSYNDVLHRFLQKLNDAAEEISKAVSQIEEKQKELDDGQESITEGQNTLAEKQEEYVSGKAEYEQKLAEANSSAALLSSAWTSYNTLQEDISAAMDLKNSIAAFIEVMSEDTSSSADDPSSDDKETTDEDPSPDAEVTFDEGYPDAEVATGESNPDVDDTLDEGNPDVDDTLDEGNPDDDPSSDVSKAAQREKQQAAADAVIASAGRLYHLIHSQSDDLSTLTDFLGENVDVDGLAAICEGLMNCDSPEEVQAQLDAANAWLESTVSNILNQVDNLYEKLASAQAQLDFAYSQLEAAATELSDGLRQLTEGKAQLEDAIAKFTKGKKALSDARKELADKQAQYDDATASYNRMNDAAATVYEVIPTVFNRNTNIALSSAYTIRNVIWKARSILASIFLVVAVLVGYTTLARMVADTTLQIGTKKALGFTRWETLRLYVLYAFSAAGIGALLGTAGACGIEMIFNTTFSSMFEVETLPTVIWLPQVLIPFGLELLLLNVAVALATLRQLNRKAIDLLKGTAESGGMKNRPSRFPLFRKMSMLNRIIFANLRQDKRRVAAMLIGIGGSTMLITSGLTCWTNMGRSVELEFSSYYLFDTIIRYDPTDEEASSQVQELLDKYEVSYAEVYHTHILTTDNSGATRVPDVFVPVDQEELSKVMRFNNEDGNTTDYTDGLWIADSYSVKLDQKTDDMIKIKSLEGDEAEFSISGFYKSYLPTLTMVVDMDTWKSAYPDTVANGFLVRTDGIDKENLQAELYNLNGYVCSIPFRDNSRTSFRAILSIIAASAGTFSAMAVLLLLMLLVNLLDMYIAEKKRELIILKINGYPGRKVKQHIWKDTLILTLTGILVGIVIGTVQGNITQNALEGDEMLLYHGISWQACGAAAAVVGLMSLLITLIELRKVDKFHLSDINN